MFWESTHSKYPEKWNDVVVALFSTVSGGCWFPPKKGIATLNWCFKLVSNASTFWLYVFVSNSITDENILSTNCSKFVTNCSKLYFFAFFLKHLIQYWDMRTLCCSHHFFQSLLTVTDWRYIWIHINIPLFNGNLIFQFCI